MAEGFVDVTGNVWVPLITKVGVGPGVGGGVPEVTANGIVSEALTVPLVPVIMIGWEEGPTVAVSEADTSTVVAAAEG